MLTARATQSEVPVPTQPPNPGPQPDPPPAPVPRPAPVPPPDLPPRPRPGPIHASRSVFANVGAATRSNATQHVEWVVTVLRSDLLQAL